MAMKLRLAALRINSMDMKITMMLRRVSTPATPIMKSRAPIVRNLDKSGCCAFCQAVVKRPLVASWNKNPNAGVKNLSSSNGILNRSQFILGRQAKPTSKRFRLLVQPEFPLTPDRLQLPAARHRDQRHRPRLPA